MTRSEAERLRKATLILKASESRMFHALRMMVELADEAMREIDAEDKVMDAAMGTIPCPHCGSLTLAACAITGCPFRAVP